MFEKKNTPYQNLCDAAKTGFRRKVIVINIVIRKKKDLK